MSASEQLKRLEEGATPGRELREVGIVLFRALPEIRAVVEAAERERDLWMAHEAGGPLPPTVEKIAAALDDLDKRLEEV